MRLMGRTQKTIRHHYVRNKSREKESIHPNDSNKTVKQKSLRMTFLFILECHLHLCHRKDQYVWISQVVPLIKMKMSTLKIPMHAQMMMQRKTKRKILRRRFGKDQFTKLQLKMVLQIVRHYQNILFLDMMNGQVREKIDRLMEKMDDFKNSQRVWMESKFNEIMAKINLLFASGIAKSLGPVVSQQSPVTPATPLQPPVTPSVISPTPQKPSFTVGTNQQPPVMSHSPSHGSSQQQVTSAASETTQPLPLSEVSMSEMPEVIEVRTGSDHELMGSRKVVSLFIKSRNRGNFAALMTAELFDKETRRISNVRGWGKEKLDPDIMDFVRTTCFQYYPIGREGDENEEKAWGACITAIDTKNRKLKTCDKENN